MGRGSRERRGRTPTATAAGTDREGLTAREVAEAEGEGGMGEGGRRGGGGVGGGSGGVEG